MKIIFSNQALQKIYIIANAHKATAENIFVLDRLFDAIEDSVQEFEIQIQAMKAQGEELEKKSQNTSFKQEERDWFKKEIDQLNKDFEAVHFSNVEIDIDNDIIEIIQEVIGSAIAEEKIAWRRTIKCITQAKQSIALAQ